MKAKLLLELLSETYKELTTAEGAYKNVMREINHHVRSHYWDKYVNNAEGIFIAGKQWKAREVFASFTGYNNIFEIDISIVVIYSSSVHTTKRKTLLRGAQLCVNNVKDDWDIKKEHKEFIKVMHWTLNIDQLENLPKLNFG